MTSTTNVYRETLPGRHVEDIFYNLTECMCVLSDESDLYESLFQMCCCLIDSYDTDIPLSAQSLLYKEFMVVLYGGMEYPKDVSVSDDDFVELVYQRVKALHEEHGVSYREFFGGADMSTLPVQDGLVFRHFSQLLKIDQISNEKKGKIRSLMRIWKKAATPRNLRNTPMQQALFREFHNTLFGVEFSLWNHSHFNVLVMQEMDIFLGCYKSSRNMDRNAVGM